MIGRTLLHYRIVEKLGEGGMGVVYKALDTHLDRFVAIKVLPPDKVADAERKRRFVLEAKAASALNHHGIITIHDIASSGDIDFIVMEYVQGKTLTQLIARKRLAFNDSLRYAIQIADALATAHAAGIVHRDLKPENVIVSGSEGGVGSVKILDFGLAKLTDQIQSGASESTQPFQKTDDHSTGAGTILGTVAYMSPEQAEGKKVDARSDIFSFGALFYEMVTGRRAFQGDSKLSTLSAILRDEPKPPSQVVDGVPRELERIITRCLRKNPDRRFQAVPDLKVALEELKEESDSGTLGAGPVVPGRRSRNVVWAAALLAVAALLGSALWFLRSASKAPEVVLHPVPLTTYQGFQEEPSFSPDGNQLAFTWNGQKRDNWDIYVKLIGTAGPPLRLTTDPSQDWSPAWSPDGRFVAFFRQLTQDKDKAAVLLVPALGGPEHKVTETLTSYRVPSPYLTWSPDGTGLIFSGRDSPKEAFALFLLSIETGEKRRLTYPPPNIIGDSCPAISPDGRTLVFTRSTDDTIGDLYLLSLSPGLQPVGDVRRLTFDNRGNGRPAWTPDGREIVFGGTSDIFATSVGLWRIAPSGSAQPQQLIAFGDVAAQPAISPRARRLAYVNEYLQTSIWRMEAPANAGSGNANSLRPFSKAAPFISSTRNDDAPQFSPDGKRIAFQSTRSGHEEIWTADGEGSNAAQLTSFAGPDVTTPQWSPDGEHIAFDSDAAGEFDIWVVSSSGGKPQRMTTDPANDGNPSWSKDGRWIYFDSARTGEQQIFKIPANGGVAMQLTRDGGFAPRESPDGKFLYYTKGLFDSSLWRVPVEGGQPSKVLDGLSQYENLAIKDSGVYFVPSGRARSSSIQYLSFATGKTLPVATFENPIPGGIAVSPDGHSILYSNLERSGSELMLVDNFH
jgi:Tol biopolymer transport system component/predicted Ser/Thr protein kinase